MSSSQDEFTVLYRQHYEAVARYVSRRVTKSATGSAAVHATAQPNGHRPRPGDDRPGV
jgi:hypothetical protein